MVLNGSGLINCWNSDFSFKISNFQIISDPQPWHIIIYIFNIVYIVYIMFKYLFDFLHNNG